MLIIALGTQASGSTWLFNVVLALFEAAGMRVFSSFADDGLDALDKMPLDVSNVVLKSHAMDQRLLRIAQLAGARIVVTTRDPMDSVVSQRERFSATTQEASKDISRAYATIRSLPPDLPTLRFVYEDRFTERRETIATLAEFLGITVDCATIERIFDDLTPEKVRTRIAKMISALPDGSTPSHDTVKHWHPAHVGDGKTGKWRERLDLSSQAIVSGCLSPLTSPEQLGVEPITWLADLFVFQASELDPLGGDLTCEGVPDLLSWGPYLHLPRGRWRAIPEISTDTRGLQIKADVFRPWDGLCLTQELGQVPSIRGPNLVLEFDHDDHYQPLEARLWSVKGVRGRFTFMGWKIHYLHPLV